MPFPKKSKRGKHLYLYKKCNVEGFRDLTVKEYEEIKLLAAYIPLGQTDSFNDVCLRLARDLIIERTLSRIRVHAAPNEDLDAYDDDEANSMTVESDQINNFTPRRKSRRLNRSPEVKGMLYAFYLLINFRFRQGR